MPEGARQPDGAEWLESLLSAVAENMTEGLVVATVDGQMLHWNRAAVLMHGYRDREECLRMVPEFATHFRMTTLDGEIIPFPDWPMLRILRGETLRDHEILVGREEWQRVFSYSGTIAKDPAGRALAFVTVKDVTERHERDQRQRSTLDRLFEGCQIIDFDYRYLYINEVAARHGRTERAQLVGRTMMEAYPGIEETPLFATLRECMHDRVTRTRENTFAYPDGRQGTFELMIQPIPEGLLIASLDITEKKHAQAAMLQWNARLEDRVAERTAQLEQAVKELEAFSYSVSHDLRAPLRAVDGFSHAVLEEYGETLPEEGKRYLQTIRGGAQRMGLLIDDLLSFSRLSRLPLKKRAVDMNALVTSALQDLTSQEVDLRVAALPSAKGDPALLKQVWMNLLSNALKYSSKASAPVVEVGAEEQEGETAYFVRDNGTGFDMRFAGKLFGVFQRLHRDDEYDGTGVGLAIVKRVIDRHGGRIWADAAVGRGATFHFTLGGAPE